MIQGFENISENQFDVLKNAISWITVLIAGADGKIDKEETDWAVKLTKIRSYANPNSLTPFYEEVGKDFTKKLKDLLAAVPQDTQKRNELLQRKLAEINEILPKLDNKIAYALYQSYTSFAEHVAKESGGFMGFFSISKEETNWIGLPMIDPIELEEGDE